MEDSYLSLSATIDVRRKNRLRPQLVDSEAIRFGIRNHLLPVRSDIAPPRHSRQRRYVYTHCFRSITPLI